MGVMKGFFAHGEHGQSDEPAATDAVKEITKLKDTVLKMRAVALATGKDGLDFLDEAINKLDDVNNVVTKGPEALQSLQAKEAKQTTPLFHETKQQLQETKQQDVAQEEVENESGSRLGMS
ncbi:hypothetical protein [Legionella sp. WA2022007384]